jgi:hypothetical protein
MNQIAESNNQQASSTRDNQLLLDRLEASIAEVKVLYEQYFSAVLPLPPDKMRHDVSQQIKFLLKSPFKNSATRFRLKTLVTRFQTYSTYWERVLKQREEGTYKKDIFKAELRQRQSVEKQRQISSSAIQENSLKQLFNVYEDAVRKSGGNTTQLSFESFKRSMLKTAENIKTKHGNAKIQYKVVMQDGKVVVKASAANKTDSAK